MKIRGIEWGGVARTALMTIPPSQFEQVDEKNIRLKSRWPDITPVLLPERTRVRPMPGWMSWTGVPAMFLPWDVMWVNPNQWRQLTETIVHELVHYVQRLRMGRVAYTATFFYQFLVAFVRAGTKWHDVHLMEREARRIAQLIVDQLRLDPSRESLVLDALTEISALLPLRNRGWW